MPTSQLSSCFSGILFFKCILYNEKGAYYYSYKYDTVAYQSYQDEQEQENKEDVVILDNEDDMK